MTAIAEFDNLVKFYGSQQALGPLTLALPETSVGLLGPNGAGKSTLIRIMMGLIPPSSGTLRVLGEEVTAGSKALRQRIGYVPEGEALFPELSGVESVTYAGQLVGMRGVEAFERANQVLDYVGLGEVRLRKAETYSTGMRQRLKLAQALVHDPELLILDEPTEGVDPQAREGIMALIQELQVDHGLKIMISTHLLHDVERLTAHAIVLKEGRAVASGSIGELKAARSDAYFVRVNGPIEPVLERFRNAGIAAEPIGASIRVATSDPRQILRVVGETGLVVRHLAPVELTLGEAFEQAVGGATGA